MSQAQGIFPLNPVCSHFLSGHILFLGAGDLPGLSQPLLLGADGRRQPSSEFWYLIPSSFPGRDIHQHLGFSQVPAPQEGRGQKEHNAGSPEVLRHVQVEGKGLRQGSMHPLVHSYNQCLLSTYYVPSPVLDE